MFNQLTHGIAIMIGCSPAFAILIRKRLNTKKASYGAEGYMGQPNDSIKLKSTTSSAARPKRDKDVYWDDTHSSQEELARNSAHSVVTTVLPLDDEQSRNTLRT